MNFTGLGVGVKPNMGGVGNVVQSSEKHDQQEAHADDRVVRSGEVEQRDTTNSPDRRL